MKREERRYFIASLVVVILGAIAMFTAAARVNTGADLPPKAPETEAVESMRLNSDYVPAETLSWDHEANARHGWIYFNAEDQFNSTYMGVHLITNTESKQYKWLNSHFWDYTDEGICIYEDRYLVALTPEFGSVGDHVDLAFKDGSVLKTIIVDVKWNAEKYGHRVNGKLNVLELIVSPEWYEENRDNMLFPDVIGYRTKEVEE